MDWTGFIPSVLISVIGSFLGFGFALIAEYIIVAKRKKAGIFRLITNLNNETQAIKKYLNNKDFVPHIKIPTPVWDSVISTGDLLILQKTHYEYYTKVLEIYCKVNLISELKEGLYVTYMKQLIKSIDDLPKKQHVLVNAGPENY